MPLTESFGVFLTKIRKRLQSQTVDIFTLNRVYLMAVTEMIKAYGYEEAMKRVFEWGYIMGHAYLLRLEKDVEKFSHNEITTRLIGRTAWYIFSGTDPEVIVEKHDFFGKEALLLIVRDRNSPWDKEFTIGKKIAYYPAGAYEGAANTFTLIVEKGRIKCFSRNTKSLSAGDECTEIVTIYVPKEATKEQIEKVFPGFLNDIVSYEMSEELYKRVVSPE